MATLTIPWKSLSFLEIWRAQNPSKITKNNSQGIIFVIISCQRVIALRHKKCDHNKKKNCKDYEISHVIPWKNHSFGPVLGRTDVLRIFISGPPIFFANVVAGSFFVGQSSGGNKRDKPKGTNAQDSQFFADFRRFLLIFAFPGNYSISVAQIFAENRRKPQIFAENRRKPQIFAETRLSHLVCPF